MFRKRSVTTRPRTESPKCSNLRWDVSPWRGAGTGHDLAQRFNGKYIHLVVPPQVICRVNGSRVIRKNERFAWVHLRGIHPYLDDLRRDGFA